MKTVQMMKVFAMAGVVMISACERNDETTLQSIEGVYSGTLERESGLKGITTDVQRIDAAKAEVTLAGDGLIEVHCYGGDLDSTWMLNYYEQHDSVMVCFTGTDFNDYYGHMLGSGHMSGGMMSDRQKGETAWMHHMNDEHSPGDKHFGGFDLKDASFTYSFQMIGHLSHYTLKFHGIKEK